MVFTDIRMPIMDGVELMQRVRRQYPEMMLVVLSGYSDFSYVSEAVRSQAVDYLLKPLTEEALSGLLSQLKERYLAREHEQIRRKLAERINKAAPPSGGGKRAGRTARRFPALRRRVADLRVSGNVPRGGILERRGAARSRRGNHQ